MALFFSLNDHHRDETDGDAGEILSRSDNILCPDRFRPVPPGGTGGATAHIGLFKSWRLG